MAIANKFPTIRPSLNLDFANSKTVDPRITFSRASSATYFDEKGVMRTAPAGVPRIDFDPATGECKGLLIEEQQTNLLTYSDQFNNAAWTKGRVSVVENAVISPGGTLTADKLVEDTTVSNTHFITQTKNATSNAMTFSCYAKAAERTRFQLQAYEATTPASPVSVLFDLSTGTVISSTGNTTSAYIVPVGNGWYRCVATGTAALLSTTWNIRLASGSDTYYTGDGTSGIYIWGVQLEEGSFPTSYIKTEASQVTRAADIFGPASLGVIGAGSAVIDAQARSGQTLMSSGATVVLAPDNSRHRIAVGYDSTSTSSSTDGTAVVSAAGSTGGADFSLMPNATGYVRRMAIYPRKLSDTNLQAMTA